jgi:hypothetical protein
MLMRVSLAVCLLVALPVAGLTNGASAPGDKILEFDTMVGVAGPFRGSANNIRGINGGGAPWQLTEASGELGSDGRLEIRVRGLVLVTTGLNPSANFRAVVSCLTTDPTNTVAATANVTTDPFPATTTGDADIEAVVALPTPCIAPIVFVTNAAGTSWFSATGR